RRRRHPRRETTRPRLVRRGVPDRRVPGARGVRLLRDRVPRPPRPSPDPDARGLRRLAAAARLPDRRRPGAVHPQRERNPGVVGLSDGDRGKDEALGTLDEPTLAERETLERPGEVIGTSPIERPDAEANGDRDHELLTVNMGPHHPATHGVLRLLVELEGEVVKEVKPIVGYLHTGIEKNCEEKPYWKVIPYVERMDYLSYFFQMQAFCG